MTSASVHLIRGDDPTLVSRAVHDLVDRLLDGADRSLAVEEIDEAAYRNDAGDHRISPLVDAAQTPPFLTDHRVVIGRALGLFSKAADVAPLVAYLSSPLGTTRLVLVWERAADQQRLSPMPKPLTEALAGVAETIDVSVPRGRQAQAWLEETVAAAGLELRRDAMRLLGDHVGEDHARVPALLETIAAVHGRDRPLGADDIQPYLGDAGDVAPWELADAIADGDVAGALDKLARMRSAGGRHALQILASLTAHYGRLLRLDGAGIRDEKAAAAALGIKGSTFPAKKALTQARAMGHQRVRRAIELLATADLDVRGATAVDDGTTLEVLVARLATLHR